MRSARSFLFSLAFATIAECGSLGATLDLLQSPNQAVQYVSPLNGSVYNRPETNIIIRLRGIEVPDAVVNPEFISVVGSESGVHSGRTQISDNAATIVFVPGEKFRWGEIVDVRATVGMALGRPSASLTFSFAIMPKHVDPIDSVLTLDRFAAGDSLPLDFPFIQSSIYQTPSPGFLFLSNFRFTAGANTPYLMILNDEGRVAFHRKLNGSGLDFKLQPTGTMTYYDNGNLTYYALDSTLAIADSFRCGNGYSTDQHELQLLPNGHALLLSYDPQEVDMSQIVPGGNPNAIVTGLIVQELDREKNVVFQWRSWDHFEITDATHQDLTAARIDYVHGNAIEVDNDDNILISCRHMDEITKINRETGDIIWRWGGKNNQFTFANDTIGFSHQHDVRRIANGHLTLFDNGNYHSPQFSRAVEYALDETGMTATLVWEYRNDPPIFGGAMGSVQRLANGNTLIGWGATNPTATEVDPVGAKVMEMSFPGGVFSYRAFRFQLNVNSVVLPPVPEAFALSQNYPNPFNGGTRYTIRIPVESSVSLEIFDLLGRKVMTVLDNVRRNAGTYFVDLDFSGRATGVYLSKFVINGVAQTRKLVYVR
jgi:hypothetical protein